MLAQIYKCFAYCSKEKRYLIIDTEIKDFFNEKFSNYFSFRDRTKGTTALNKTFSIALEQFKCYPREVTGRIGRYSAEQIPGCERDSISKELGHFTNLRDSESKSPLSFHFGRAYGERVILHHCSGGGAELALKAMDALRPRKSFRNEIDKKISVLPRLYHSVHIRNTDLKADLDKVKQKFSEWKDVPILVCTDDLTLIGRLREENSDANLLSLLDFAEYRDAKLSVNTLHKGNPQLPRHAVNLTMFAELVAMSLSDQFYAAPLLRNGIKDVSGFSEFVLGFRKDRKILEKFIVPANKKWRQ